LDFSFLHIRIRGGGRRMSFPKVSVVAVNILLVWEQNAEMFILDLRERK
jgi:hypothetical protein